MAQPNNHEKVIDQTAKQLDPQILGVTLLTAARNYHLDSEITLLRERASSRCTDPTTGNSALHYAILYHDTEMLKALLEANANLSQTNRKNQTPIDLALELRHWDMIDLIAKNRTATAGDPEHFGKAFIIAVQYNHHKTAMALLNSRASTGWYDCETGNYAIHYAIKHHDVELLDALLKTKVDLTLSNKNNQTPMDLALELRHWDMINLIAKNHIATKGDPEHFGNALVIAVRDNYPGIAMALLNAKAPTNCYETSTGNFAIHHAVLRHDVVILNALLGANVDIRQTNFRRQTAIDLAVERNHWDMIALIANKCRNHSENPERQCFSLLTATQNNKLAKYKDALLKESNTQFRSNTSNKSLENASNALKKLIYIASDLKEFRSHYKRANTQRINLINDLKYQIGKSYIEIYNGKNPAEVIKTLVENIRDAQQEAQKDHALNGTLRFQCLQFFKPTNSRLARTLNDIIDRYGLNQESHENHAERITLSPIG